MKTIIFYGFLLLGFTATFAQEDTELQTISIKIENFISYIAAQENTALERRIFLALEIGENGLEAEERFYIEQGIKLLSKKVTENSLIAIGTYGAKGQLIMPYTQIIDIKDVTSLIQTIQLDRTPGQTDGLDLAFQTAALQLKEGIDNDVIILRNDHVKSTNYAIAAVQAEPKLDKKPKEKAAAVNHTKLGGALALTALTILPDILEIIKN